MRERALDPPRAGARRAGQGHRGSLLQFGRQRLAAFRQTGGAQGRHHAVVLQQIARRRDEPRPGDDEIAVIGQPHDALHGALAE